MSDARPIGIVGLGLMGAALAERLTGAGHAVLGFDIDPAKSAALEKLGIAAAASLPDLVRQCDILFVAVFDTDQVEDVTENAILPAAGENSGKIVLCVSTCDPDRIAALAARPAFCRSAGVGHERTGAARTGRRPDRRRSRGDRKSRCGAARGL